jgi:hypothetical protein
MRTNLFVRLSNPSEVARLLLKEHPVKCVGQQFPAPGHGQRADFVFEGEAHEEFQVGFYVFDEYIMYLGGNYSPATPSSPSQARNSHDPTQISRMPPLQTLTQ